MAFWHPGLPHFVEMRRRAIFSPTILELRPELRGWLRENAAGRWEVDIAPWRDGERAEYGIAFEEGADAALFRLWWC